ncbi:sensor histidine kinase [Paenibacillus ehimensis]|uniref:sensor histidine kinase n=1 Tax=Paenibacillus ehimensis TaxID=79264 RepID=UPI000FDC4BA4|nr:sensor histidine kinase [Paenibacillus ehimensis]MEC0210212.1 sensor histidine kinase [Paenibacillus ehimensis]
MRLRDYIRSHKLWLISNAVLVLLTNGILFGSVPLGQGTADIVYMDVLLVTTQLVFFVYGYVKQKRTYARFLHDTGEKGRKTDPQGDFYTDMLTKALERQHKLFSEKEEEYKKKMNETQEYMTQWVHDIKVNLAVSELLLEEMENGHELRNQIEQMKFRIHQVLQMTRATHYNEDMAAEEVDVCQVLRNAIKENALFFIHKNIEIETDLKPFTVISDKKWVFDILCQILNNSSKYTPPGGRLTIAVREEERAYYVSIRDNGIGIPREDLPRIFDKGFTGKNGRSGTKSTGMGLYYAKKMAERLSIGLEAASEEGAYTEFTVIFYKLSDYYTVYSAIR